MTTETIIAFEQFQSSLQFSAHLAEIQNHIFAISPSKAKAIVAKLLEEEDKVTEKPHPQWLKTQQFYEPIELPLIAESVKDSLGDAEFARQQEERLEKIAAAKKIMRDEKKVEEIEKEFRDYLGEKQIIISANLSERIKIFFGYLITHRDADEFPALMQEFCQYVILMDKKQPVKIKECLGEFPPSRAYLECVPGTRGRLQQQIRNLIFPKELRPVSQAESLTIEALSQTLSANVQPGNHTHIPDAVRHSFGLRAKDKIKDQLYVTPRAELRIAKMLQANQEFATKFKEFLWQKYQEYNGAVALFTRFQDINSIVHYAEYGTDFYESDEEDGNKSDAEKQERKRVALEDLQTLNEELRDLGIEGGYAGMCFVGETVIWNWQEVADRLIKMQQQDFQTFMRSFGLDENLNANPSVSQPAEDDGLTNALDRIEPQQLAANILSDNIDARMEALDALWMMSYFEHQQDSYIKFVRAFHELGRMFYEGRADKDGLDANKHFENAKICLRRIKNDLPQSQQFKIDDLVERIDLDKFMVPIFFASWDEKIILTKKILDFTTPIQQQIQFILANQFGAFGYIEKYYQDNQNITQLNRLQYNPNDPSQYSFIIHMAVQFGQKKIVEFLITKGANINSQDSFGMSPLMIACRNCDVQMFNLLFKQNPDLKSCDIAGNNILHNAVLGGNEDIVGAILDADSSLIDQSNIHLDLPLDFAYRCASLDLIRFMLEKIKDKRLPLDLDQEFIKVCNLHRLDVAKHLIGIGAHINLCFGRDDLLFELTTTLQSRYEDKYQILKFAVDNGYKFTQEEAIDFVNEIIAEDRPQPQEEFVKLIFQNLVEQGVDIKQDAALQKLIMGYYVNNFKIIQECLTTNQVYYKVSLELLDYLESSDLQDEEGCAILHYAINYGIMNENDDLVDELLKRGANINLQDNFGYTPLLFAVQNGNRSNIEKLLAKGCDVNLKCDCGEEKKSAVMIAAEDRLADVVKTLLEHGACIDDCIDESGLIVDIESFPESYRETISECFEATRDLFVAVRDGDPFLVQQFIDNGAIVFATNQQGKTPLDLANAKGNLEIIGLLERKIHAIRSGASGTVSRAAADPVQIHNQLVPD